MAQHFRCAEYNKEILQLFKTISKMWKKNSNPQCPNITFEIIVQEHQFCKEAVKEIRKALEVYLEKPKNKNSKEWTVIKLREKFSI